MTPGGLNALGHRLIARIRSDGPLTLAEYMAECLLHPQHGYYSTREPFGTAGDFITAPEVSQMFGELIGLWLAQSWLDRGAPAPFTLAELGPGRGTLMADALRATARVPGFHAALRLVLVEASERLRARQAEALAPHAVEWVTDVAALPEAPLFLVANEFLDALPIRQFRRDPAGWREVMVTEAGGRLAFALGAAGPQPVLSHRLADTAAGDTVEICPAAAGIIAAIGERIGRHGGVALIVDYGGWRSLGDTFQALRAHAPADPLETPGEADLTAHVDFEALAQALPAGTQAGTLTQRELLIRLGIRARAERLAQGLGGDRLAAHLAAAERLTDPREMGTLFKALAFWRRGAPPPPAFDPLPSEEDPE